MTFAASPVHRAGSGLSGSDRPAEEADVLCVGFGPANIALAVAFRELAPGVDVKFLEARSDAVWQPQMMLDGADIQNSPIRDLVTPRNPRSRFTFINYLHENGRLFKHLNLPGDFPLRKEYARYIRWVAENVGADVEYGRRVLGIEARTGDHVVVARTESGHTYRARALVLAPGRTPYVPDAFAHVSEPHVLHTADYLRGVADLPADWTGSLALIGASQSACEVMLDLMTRLPRARLVNVMSGFGYRLKDTSPFSEEVYFPDFVDYYFEASDQGKELLRGQLRPTNYSAADRDVIDALYSRLYEEELDGVERVSICSNRRIDAVRQDASGRVLLDITEQVTGSTDRIAVDRVVLATGYRDAGTGNRDEVLPPLLGQVRDFLQLDSAKGLVVGRNYQVSTPLGFPPIFVNGLCESTHGFGDAGSFSLLSLRSQTIVEALRDELRTPSPRHPGSPTPRPPVARRAATPHELENADAHR